MARKRYTTEQIIGLLREAEVRWDRVRRSARSAEESASQSRATIAGGASMAVLKLDQAKRLKDLDRENERLKRAVSELTLDKLILKEALEGKY